MLPENMAGSLQRTRLTAIVSSQSSSAISPEQNARQIFDEVCIYGIFCRNRLALAQFRQLI